MNTNTAENNGEQLSRAQIERNEAMAAREKIKAAYRAEAARRMSGFCYTQLVSNESIEAWHCAKPGTGCYSFTITALHNGMAVTGDIDGMLFNVGSFGSNAYGIPYLTHPDKHYVSSKLEQQCRKMEFDGEYFLQVVAQHAASQIDELTTFEAAERESMFPGGEPEWLNDRYKADHETVLAWLRAAGENTALKNYHSDIRALTETLDMALAVDNTHEAYEFLQDEEPLQCSDVTDYTLEKLDEELVQRLYMLEHAAAAIQGIKHPKSETVKETENAITSAA